MNVSANCTNQKTIRQAVGILGDKESLNMTLPKRGANPEETLLCRLKRRRSSFSLSDDLRYSFTGTFRALRSLGKKFACQEQEATVSQPLVPRTQHGNTSQRSRLPFHHEPPRRTSSTVSIERRGGGVRRTEGGIRQCKENEPPARLMNPFSRAPSENSSHLLAAAPQQVGSV